MTGDDPQTGASRGGGVSPRRRDPTGSSFTNASASARGGPSSGRSGASSVQCKVVSASLVFFHDKTNHGRHYVLALTVATGGTVVAVRHFAWADIVRVALESVYRSDQLLRRLQTVQAGSAAQTKRSLWGRSDTAPSPMGGSSQDACAYERRRLYELYGQRVRPLPETKVPPLCDVMDAIWMSYCDEDCQNDELIKCALSHDGEYVSVVCAGSEDRVAMVSVAALMSSRRPSRDFFHVTATGRKKMVHAVEDGTAEQMADGLATNSCKIWGACAVGMTGHHAMGRADDGAWDPKPNNGSDGSSGRAMGRLGQPVTPSESSEHVVWGCSDKYGYVVDPTTWLNHDRAEAHAADDGDYAVLSSTGMARHRGAADRHHLAIERTPSALRRIGSVVRRHGTSTNLLEMEVGDRGYLEPMAQTHLSDPKLWWEASSRERIDRALGTAKAKDFMGMLRVKMEGGGQRHRLEVDSPASASVQKRSGERQVLSELALSSSKLALTQWSSQVESKLRSALTGARGQQQGLISMTDEGISRAFVGSLDDMHIEYAFEIENVHHNHALRVLDVHSTVSLVGEPRWILVLADGSLVSVRTVVSGGLERHCLARRSVPLLGSLIEDSSAHVAVKTQLIHCKHGTVIVAFKDGDDQGKRGGLRSCVIEYVRDDDTIWSCFDVKTTEPSFYIGDDYQSRIGETVVNMFPLATGAHGTLKDAVCVVYANNFVEIVAANRVRTLAGSSARVSLSCSWCFSFSQCDICVSKFVDFLPCGPFAVVLLDDGMLCVFMVFLDQVAHDAVPLHLVASVGQVRTTLAEPYCWMNLVPVAGGQRSGCDRHELAHLYNAYGVDVLYYSGPTRFCSVLCNAFDRHLAAERPWATQDVMGHGRRHRRKQSNVRARPALLRHVVRAMDAPDGANGDEGNISKGAQNHSDASFHECHASCWGCVDDVRLFRECALIFVPRQRKRLEILEDSLESIADTPFAWGFPVVERGVASRVRSVVACCALLQVSGGRKKTAPQSGDGSASSRPESPGHVGSHGSSPVRSPGGRAGRRWIFGHCGSRASLVGGLMHLVACGKYGLACILSAAVLSHVWKKDIIVCKVDASFQSMAYHQCLSGPDAERVAPPAVGLARAILVELHMDMDLDLMSTYDIGLVVGVFVESLVQQWLLMVAAIRMPVSAVWLPALDTDSVEDTAQAQHASDGSARGALHDAAGIRQRMIAAAPLWSFYGYSGVGLLTCVNPCVILMEFVRCLPRMPLPRDVVGRVLDVLCQRRVPSFIPGIELAFVCNRLSECLALFRERSLTNEEVSFTCERLRTQTGVKSQDVFHFRVLLALLSPLHRLALCIRRPQFLALPSVLPFPVEILGLRRVAESTWQRRTSMDREMACDHERVDFWTALVRAMALEDPASKLFDHGTVSVHPFSQAFGVAHVTQLRRQGEIFGPNIPTGSSTGKSDDGPDPAVAFDSDFVKLCVLPCVFAVDAGGGHDGRGPSALLDSSCARQYEHTWMALCITQELRVRPRCLSTMAYMGLPRLLLSTLLFWYLRKDDRSACRSARLCAERCTNTSITCERERDDDVFASSYDGDDHGGGQERLALAALRVLARLASTLTLSYAMWGQCKGHGGGRDDTAVGAIWHDTCSQHTPPALTFQAQAAVDYFDISNLSTMQRLGQGTEHQSLSCLEPVCLAPQRGRRSEDGVGRTACAACTTSALCIGAQQSFGRYQNNDATPVAPLARVLHHCIASVDAVFEIDADDVYPVPWTEACSGAALRGGDGHNDDTLVDSVLDTKKVTARESLKHILHSAPMQGVMDTHKGGSAGHARDEQDASLKATAGPAGSIVSGAYQAPLVGRLRSQNEAEAFKVERMYGKRGARCGVEAMYRSRAWASSRPFGRLTFGDQALAVDSSACDVDERCMVSRPHEWVDILLCGRETALLSVYTSCMAFNALPMCVISSCVLPGVQTQGGTHTNASQGTQPSVGAASARPSVRPEGLHHLALFVLVAESQGAYVRALRGRMLLSSVVVSAQLASDRAVQEAGQPELPPLPRAVQYVCSEVCRVAGLYCVTGRRLAHGARGVWKRARGQRMTLSEEGADDLASACLLEVAAFVDGLFGSADQRDGARVLRHWHQCAQQCVVRLVSCAEGVRVFGHVAVCRLLTVISALWCTSGQPPLSSPCDLSLAARAGQSAVDVSGHDATAVVLCVLDGLAAL